MFACVNGHTATAELLIAKGANVEAKDRVRQGKREYGGE
jgi:ankyrin repeat protein